ncbi:MAG: hypothetical protein GY716_14650 [bacterium]|nr:hypothetical protein [bacterium]
MRRIRSVLICVLLLGDLALANSIPAWLDDAIGKHNAEQSEEGQILFVDIKNNFVWYTVPKTSESQQTEIRASVYGLAESNGYVQTQEEERVTLARPPTTGGKHTEKKCWNRSFLLDLDHGKQRMLTTLICAGDGEWLIGFRSLE